MAVAGTEGLSAPTTRWYVRSTKYREAATSVAWAAVALSMRPAAAASSNPTRMDTSASESGRPLTRSYATATSSSRSVRPGRVPPVDLSDADHAERSKLDRPQRAHAGGAVHVVAGAQGIENLVGAHGHGVKERAVDDADDPRRAPGRDEPGQVTPRDGRVELRVAQPARRVEAEGRSQEDEWTAHGRSR